jgi:cytochrome b561
MGLGVGVLVALHPAREQFLRRGTRVSAALLAITALGAIPLTGYALSMGALARELPGPPHHVLRLSTMVARALALVLVGAFAALGTTGWRIPAWSAGAAAVVFGLASVVFPDHPAAAGRAWGTVAIAGGALFVATAEWQARRVRRPTPAEP